MKSPIYGFILNMWIMQRVTADKVQSYVPKGLSQIECDMILVTPQGDEYDVQSVPQLK